MDRQERPSDWDHPFHLHGFFFQVIDDKAAAGAAAGMEGHRQRAAEQTVRLLVRFDERPGEWMFHCHILDHADGGLMGTVLVGDGPAKGHSHAPGSDSSSGNDRRR